MDVNNEIFDIGLVINKRVARVRLARRWQIKRNILYSVPEFPGYNPCNRVCARMLRRMLFWHHRTVV